MKAAHLFGTLTLLGVLTGCSESVPPEKTSYVGEWKDVTMQLLITRDGSVKYERVKGSTTTRVSGPLKGFEGNDFEVGFGPFSTTFVVSKPPYREGGGWRMVVDDVELVKVH
jgi:hypothetical protein